MTREKAIEILQGAIKRPNTKDGYLGQAIDMAIQALEQTDIEQKAQEYEKAFMDGFESCSDLFTRNKEQQKSGKWITDEPTVLEPYVCSECGIFHNGKYKNFCPNCGAKMESEE